MMQPNELTLREELQQGQRKTRIEPDSKPTKQHTLPDSQRATYGLVVPNAADIYPGFENAEANGTDATSSPVAAAASPSSLAHCHLDLHLSEIRNEKIRAIFDPSRTDEDGSIDSLATWSEDELDSLVREMRPEHLSVLMRKRIHSHHQQPAKRLSFHHLNYHEKDAHIIRDCSGFIEPGEMIGISGGPDAGVSALLSLLTGELKPNGPPHHSSAAARDPATFGEVRYDGQLPRVSFQSQVGFASKQDVHLPYLTVKETLRFSAELRLHRMIHAKVISFRVAAVMKMLGLSHVANTPVGDALVRGVSGGEKRRVGFGIEMVAGHSVIIADLPTNGLDSATALDLLRSMSYAAAGGFSLLFSIVQASPAILDTMDRLILLCKGHIIYTGPPRSAEGYFRALGFPKPPTKALPQFLEEMSANPERFWIPHIMRSIAPTTIPTTTNGAVTNYDLLASDNEELFQGKYDQTLPLAPRRQAALSLAGAWKRCDTYQSMMVLLDASRQDSHPQVSLFKRTLHLVQKRFSSDPPQPVSATAAMPPVPSKKEREANKAARTEEEDRKWQASLIEFTTIPKTMNSNGTSNHAMDTPQQEPSASHVIFHILDSDDNADESAVLDSSSSSPPLHDGQTPTLLQAIDQDEVESLKLSHRLAQYSHAPKSLSTMTNSQLQARENFQARIQPPSNAIERLWFERYASTLWQQLHSNMQRQWIATIRNTGLWRDTWILAILVGVLIGLLFYQLQVDEDGVRMRVGLFFFLISYQAFNAVQLVPVLSQQRPIYYLQIHARYYSSFTYYLPLALIQIPIVVIESVLLLTPIYGISNLEGGPWKSEQFWSSIQYAFIVVVLNSLIARTFMTALYAMSPNESMADVVNQVTNIIFSKLCGFFLPFSNIPIGWAWVYWISWFTYALRGLAKNDLLNVVRPCTPSLSEECLYQNGGDALHRFYDMDISIDKWTDVVDLIWFFLSFHFGAALLVCFVDWSEMDRFEAPDWGSRVNQLKEADAACDAKKDAGGHAATGNAERAREDSLIMMAPHTASSTAVGAATAITTTVESVPAFDRGQSQFMTLRGGGAKDWTKGLRETILRTYRSADDLDEQGEKVSRFSTIVLPMIQPGSMDQPPSQPFQRQDSISFRRRPSISRGASSLNSSSFFQDDRSLTLADAKHYQHAIKRLDIGALLDSTPRIVPELTKTGDVSAQDAVAHDEDAVLEWMNLTYSVPVQNDKGETIQRKLLDNVYGYCKPGNMVALMGSSGAGKSTLLDVLANKKTGGAISGSILFNGKPRDVNFAHVSGYVEQWDSHHPYSTVREALEFSGRLRLTTEVTETELARRVDNTLQILGIDHLADELIGGGEVPGVSQEVRKKVTIAVELVTQPKLLFLDEPTTGLDAAGAFSVCSAIRTLADHIAVICTIHQPSSEIISFFDTLLIMQPGGEVAYCHSVAQLPEYFAAHGLGKYEEEMNIADFALAQIRAVNQGNAQHKQRESSPAATTAAATVPAAEAHHLAPSSLAGVLPIPKPISDAAAESGGSHYRNLPKEFLASDEGKKLMEALEQGTLHKRRKETGHVKVELNQPDGSSAIMVVPPEPRPIRSTLIQLTCLMTRDFSEVMRARRNLLIRYFLTTVMGFVVGTVFWQLSSSQAASEERVSALFVTLLFILFTANAFLPAMFSARPMYFREVTSGAYSAGPFHASRLLVQLPFVLVENLILAIMLFYIAGLNSERHDTPLSYMFLCFVITRCAAISATFFIGGLFSAPNFANTIHATYFNLLFAFTGFLVRGPKIPIGWVWFYDINFLHWSLDFLAANELRHATFQCDPTPEAHVFAPIGYDKCVMDGISVTTAASNPNFIPLGALVSDYTSDTIVKCATACGVDLLDSYGVDATDAGMTRNLGIVVSFACAFAIAGFFVLKYINHIKR